VKSVKRVKS